MEKSPIVEPYINAMMYGPSAFHVALLIMTNYYTGFLLSDRVRRDCLGSQVFFDEALIN